MTNQKVAVETGYWQLYRYNPTHALEGKNPFKLDSKAPSKPLKEFTSLETRFRMLEKSHPERAAELAKLAQGDIKERWALYEQYAHEGGNGAAGVKPSTAKPEAAE